MNINEDYEKISGLRYSFFCELTATSASLCSVNGVVAWFNHASAWGRTIDGLDLASCGVGSTTHPLGGRTIVGLEHLQQLIKKKIHLKLFFYSKKLLFKIWLKFLGKAFSAVSI